MNDQLAAPRFSPPGGIYDRDQQVALSSPDAGATIYYTTDGSLPNGESSTYESPILVGGDGTTMTIRALARKGGMEDSPVASAEYVIDYDSVAVASPVFEPLPGMYDHDVQVTLSTITPDAEIFYTVDGQTPTEASTPYASPISVSGDGTTTTIRAIAIKAGLDDSPLAIGTYTIEYQATPVATPSMTPVPGAYDTDQSVVIATTTSGATIYFTTDGSPPDSSSAVYQQPVAVSGHETTMVIKAIATKTGMANSAEASGTYTITYSETVAQPSFTPGAATYDSDQMITIDCATADALVTYTSDGSNPDRSSTPYSAPIAIEGHGTTVTLKARAFKDNMIDSAIREGTYVIQYPQVAQPSILPPAGKYPPNETIAFYSGTADVTFYHTSDGVSVPSCDGTGVEGSTAPISEDVAVIACKDGMVPSNVVERSYQLYNLMFVTSESYTGDLGGMTGADDHCNDLAESAGLPGNYRAFVSAETSGDETAWGQLGDARGWVRVDGREFVDLKEDMFYVAGENEEYSIYYPPRITETGADLGGDVAVSTGTDIGGAAFGMADCINWTSATTGSRSWGYADAVGMTWFRGPSGQNCDELMHIYCFGVDYDTVLDPPAPIAVNLAFLSSPYRPSDGGSVSDADAVCNADASAAGLTGTFKALVAEPGAQAVARLDQFGGPWFRVDYVRVAESPASILNGSLFDAPLTVLADGTRENHHNTMVWLGADDVPSTGSNVTTCDNWSDDTLSYAAPVVPVNRSHIVATDIVTCSEAARLFCFED